MLVDFAHHRSEGPIARASEFFNYVINQLLDVWRQFRFWKEEEEPNLPEEERLFHTLKNNKKVWIIEDGNGFTIMYPEDY